MIFINDLLGRIKKCDRPEVLAKVYFVSSLVFFVCPVFYLFFWRIPNMVIPEDEEGQEVTPAMKQVFAGRVIMAGATIMWGLSLIYILANGLV